MPGSNARGARATGKRGFKGTRLWFCPPSKTAVEGGAPSLAKTVAPSGTGRKAETEVIIHLKARGLAMAETSRILPSGVAEREPQPRQSQEYSVDTSALSTGYVNFCRITGTPEELIIDIGLNTQMNPSPSSEPIRLTHRLVMNFYTAKRLLYALHHATQQHENVYGVLEVDTQKRIHRLPR
jgi:hypothetical protein